MTFDETPEFKKDVKQLSKKWRSIPSDIEAVKPYLIPLYKQLAEDVEVPVYRHDFFSGKNATILKTVEGSEVVKMRLDVADLGRNDKVRIIFIAIKSEDTIKFIELFAKSNKDREDEGRIKKYLDK